MSIGDPTSIIYSFNDCGYIVPAWAHTAAAAQCPMPYRTMTIQVPMCPCEIEAEKIWATSGIPSGIQCHCIRNQGR